MTPEGWIAVAHSDSVVSCHALRGETEAHQCAGLAIYRSNVDKLPLSPNLKLSSDRMRVFASPREFLEHHHKLTRMEFQRHFAEWKKNGRKTGSPKRWFAHPSYQAIVSMGWAVVPILLQELEREPEHLYEALRRITGVSVVSRDIAGNLSEMTDAWVKWGRSQGYV